jgi:hypothetical protein
MMTVVYCLSWNLLSFSTNVSQLSGPMIFLVTLLSKWLLLRCEAKRQV